MLGPSPGPNWTWPQQTTTTQNEETKKRDVLWKFQAHVQPFQGPRTGTLLPHSPPSQNSGKGRFHCVQGFQRTAGKAMRRELHANNAPLVIHDNER